jgi:hypothetical protein
MVRAIRLDGASGYALRLAISQHTCVDIEQYADTFMKLAQALATTGLSTQQTIYRNHVIRVDQQSNELVDAMYAILHPEIARIQHPEWQHYNIVTPTHGPIPITGLPLLRPEALSYAQTLRNLAVRYANLVLHTQKLALADMMPLFQQIAGTYETIRTTYVTGLAAKMPALYLPMRQIRDSLAWMNQYHQTAQRQAGQLATVLI